MYQRRMTSITIDACQDMPHIDDTVSLTGSSVHETAVSKFANKPSLRNCPSPLGVAWSSWEQE